MWGYQINGIWQDVYLLALPKIHLEDVYVKPLVSKNTLEIEITLQNRTEKKTDVQLQGNIREWVNCAGTDVNSAPVPNWTLGNEALKVAPTKVSLPAKASQKVTLQVPVGKDILKYWTPEHQSNTYARLNSKGPTGVNSPARYIDRSFIRLENISIGYTFPKSIVSRWGLSNLKVYGTIRNAALWTMSHWKLNDIETGGLAPRTYSLGINVTL